MHHGADLDRPIVVLGAARSGTSMLAGQILALHPDIAYWSEPNFIWRYGAAYRRHDVRDGSDATPAVRGYIRARFREFVENRDGRTRFMEKTPSNCLRVPFVDAVLPDARIIHIVRDGRDVAISAAREWKGSGTPREERTGERPHSGSLRRAGRILEAQAQQPQRIRDLRSLLEAPAYLPRAVSAVGRRLTHSSRISWGPRFPGLAQTRRAMSLLETCAVQWDVSVRWARSACQAIPPQRVLDVRYEDLRRDPTTWMRRILEFTELDHDDASVADLAGRIDPPASRDWSVRLTASEIACLEARIGDTLAALGYPRIPEARTQA